MKAFVSWSGGKDCMLALHRFLKEPQNEVVSLVNMCDADSNLSRSHGLTQSIIAQQAACMGLRLTQKTTDRTNYEARFKEVIEQLKTEGVTAGVFGDIYLNEHRTWIERVCNELQIQPIFPIWTNDTPGLLNEFIEAGFKALTVSVHVDKLPQSWAGRPLDRAFYNEITAMPGIDPCAELGEYHTFVYDGPLFKSPVAFSTGQISTQDKHYFLKIEEK
jgi:diphthine-ammonia ligase